VDQARQQSTDRSGHTSGKPGRPWLHPRPHFLQKLEAAADSTGITLYQANLRTYQLLRYGVPVQMAAGAARDGAPDRLGNPEANDFALAEEVTLKGGYERRPDIVLYSTASPWW
jgi:type I site-specific restriction-modification system R (restriction) subunit